MEKEEIIKQAWGDRYEELIFALKENGWLHVELVSGVKGNEYRAKLLRETISESKYDKRGRYMMRPKSLNGLETNNEWTKVESKTNLPKESPSIKYICLEDKDGYESLGVIFLNGHWWNGDYTLDVKYYRLQPIFPPPLY